MVNFTKVVGTGNDFIVVDNRTKKFEKIVKNISKFVLEVCHRRLSIGADGVLVLEDSKKADFKMRIINSDGSEASMCGNGARCAALYAVTNKWCGNELKIETGAGIVAASVKAPQVKLKMTDPVGLELNRGLNVDNLVMQSHFINTGVPHVVYIVEDIEEYPVREMGAKIRHHKDFAPAGTNANFVKVIGDNEIRVRTYERGVEDETLACGTGSTASAIIAALVSGLKSPVKVKTQSGEMLTVYFEASGNKVSKVYLEGSAKIVFEGGIENV